MQMTRKQTSLISLVAMLCLISTTLLSGSSRSVLAENADAQQVQQEAGSSDDSAFGVGRPATEEEIAAWNIDVRPDGTGLSEGSGTVAEGAEVYAVHCARCHGETGRETPYLPFRALVGEYDPDTWPQWPLTIGNYWPYATTLFDHTRRAMPYDTPGILSDDEVYAVVAWLLNQNGIIADDAAMDAETILEVEMPALQHYQPFDPRDNYPYR